MITCNNAIHYRHLLLLLERHERRDEVCRCNPVISVGVADNFSIHFRPPRNREILRADGFRRKQRKYTVQEISDDTTARRDDRNVGETWI